MTLRLFHFEAGVKLPQHAKTAKELLHVLSANKAKIGPIDEWIKDVSNKFYAVLTILALAVLSTQIYLL